MFLSISQDRHHPILVIDPQLVGIKGSGSSLGLLSLAEIIPIRPPGAGMTPESCRCRFRVGSWPEFQGDGSLPEGFPTASLRILASSPLPFICSKKKPTWWNTPKVFDHVGLLVNEPPGQPGLPFI